MTPRALLFDFDGVIADTENHHIAAWQRTFATMGWEIPEELCLSAIEVDDRAFLARLFQTRKIKDGNIEGWVARKQELTLALLNDSPRIYPGVALLVERARALGNVKLAVVTTTTRANVAAVLKAANLYSAFSLIVAKEDVQAPKPSPEPYVLAIKSLGIRPGHTLALEDSPTGIESAQAAGVPTIAIGHRRPKGPWSGDAPFFPDLRQTNEILHLGGMLPKP